MSALIMVDTDLVWGNGIDTGNEGEFLVEGEKIQPERSHRGSAGIPDPVGSGVRVRGGFRARKPRGFRS